MQFKMAKNSLFALLLRSPWWISVAIAVLLALLARFFLPEMYARYGYSFAIPFVVIALVAAQNQWKAPSAKQVAATLDAMAAMSWRDFSALIEMAYQRDGYVVTRTNGAADFTIAKAGRTVLVSCKRWKAASHGVELLRELKARRQEQGASEAIYVTLSAVTGKAQTFANDHGIVLLQGQELARLLYLPGKRKK